MTAPEDSPALLPAGLHDELPPRAAQEAMVIARLMAACEGYGYERVKPPLVEFEDSLLSGPGQSLARQTFRVMDPQSRRMMGVRADMTVQVARIAATRLAQAPRPLRLSYAGQVLRVAGTQLRGERQFTQAGYELIGTADLAGDAEVVRIAAEALAALGVEHLSVDLTMPAYVPTVCKGLGLDAGAAQAARDLLDLKDAAGITALGGDAAEVLSAILAAAGPARPALERLGDLGLGGEAEQMRSDLEDLTGRLESALPDLALTVDPGEYRGFEYETGVGFTFFARGVRGELGRGGRYRLQNGESAVGASVYLDSILRSLPAPVPGRRVFVPAGTDPASSSALRAEGWFTVAGMSEGTGDAVEAARLGCTHIFQGGEARPLD